MTHFEKTHKIHKNSPKKTMIFSTNFLHSKTLLHIPQDPGKVNKPPPTGIWGKNAIENFWQVQKFLQSPANLPLPCRYAKIETDMHQLHSPGYHPAGLLESLHIPV